MPQAVSADDWPDTEDWWESYTTRQLFGFAPAYLRAVSATTRREDWDAIDELWTDLEADHAHIFAKPEQQAVSDSSVVDPWLTVDIFWEGYAEQQLPELRHLQDLLSTVRDRWSASEKAFDADPLTANWRPGSGYEGPLRTSINEEDWSQWLAHLLRTSTGPFVEVLFGLPSQSPETVRREVVFSDGEATRRIDILVEYPETGVSIEVKNGDSNYGKTPETARLIEKDWSREWTHVLLLQQANRPRLRQTFGDDLVTNEQTRPTIQSETNPSVDVRYWQDVSHTLRRMLTGGHEPDSHWQASAYLFITLIEQRVLNLHSTELIDSETAGNSASAARDLHRLIAVEPGRQIDYLKTLLTEEPTHE